jgi:hypothetical protein
VVSEEKIFKKNGQSETKIACGSHVCYGSGQNEQFFIEDLPRMLPTKFQFIWPRGFREED